VAENQKSQGPGGHSRYRWNVLMAWATNVVVVSLALLLSCCTNDRETKMLLGIPDTDVEETPDTATDRNIFACRQYGFYPGTRQWDECMKYVGSKRPPLLRP
jgi:hypothetical protein